MPQPTDAPLVTETKVAGREVTPGDVKATERLNRYWTEGGGAAKIRWGVPGDFDRCVALMSKYIHEPSQVKGHCANLHKRATGGWPGHAPGVESAEAAAKKVAAKEGKAAAVAERAGLTLADILDLAAFTDPEPEEPVVVDEADMPEIETEMPSPFEDGVTMLFGADGSLLTRDAEGVVTQIIGAVPAEEIEALPAPAEPDHVDVGLDDVVEQPEGETPPEGEQTDEVPPEGEQEPEGEIVDGYPVGDDGDLDPDYDPQADADPDLEGAGTKAAGRMACGKSASACTHTMPDDSYPIHNATELSKAITSYPRGAGKGGKTKKSIRGHIKAAARRLDLTEKVPDQWTGEDKALETKGAFPYMEGSAEAQTALIERALREALIPDPEPGQPNSVYVSVFGTFPDRVYCTVNDYSSGTTDESSYEVPYVIDDEDEVTLGVPVPVEKNVTVEPTDDDETDDGRVPVGGVGLAVKALTDAIESGARLRPQHHKSLRAIEALLTETTAALVPAAAPAEPVTETKTVEVGEGKALITEAEILAARATYADIV